MTREKAIKRLELHKRTWLLGGVFDLCDALDTAIAALRERETVTDIHQFKTNADHIRSMTDEELAEFLEYLYSHCDGPWEILFERKFCDHCPAPEYELEDGRNLKLHECDFTGGKCPHGSDVLWWLKQPYKEDA